MSVITDFHKGNTSAYRFTCTTCGYEYEKKVTLDTRIFKVTQTSLQTCHLTTFKNVSMNLKNVSSAGFTTFTRKGHLQPLPSLWDPSPEYMQYTLRYPPPLTYFASELYLSLAKEPQFFIHYSKWTSAARIQDGKIYEWNKPLVDAKVRLGNSPSNNSSAPKIYKLATSPLRVCRYKYTAINTIYTLASLCNSSVIQTINPRSLQHH